MNLDPKCSVAEKFIVDTMRDLDSLGLGGMARAKESLRRIEPFEAQHRPTCALCSVYDPNKDTHVETNRSPVWGGATGGLLLGLVIGFFRENYWQTVLYAVVVGAAVGFGTNLLAAFANRLARR